MSELADAGVREAGRSTDEVRKAGFVYFACSEDGDAPIEANRLKLAFLFRNSAQAENIRSIDIPLDHEAIMELVRDRELEKAARLIPAEAVAQFSVAGTPDACRAGLQAYIDAGVDMPVIKVTGSREERRLALDVIRDFNAGRS